MKRLLAPLLVALSLFAPAAQAQLFRAYLSPAGSDANPCTLPAPCRLLPAALNAVASGGEIWMLDSANFNAGTVSITKSVTILAVPGAVGSVVSTGNGAALDISTPSMKVVLRNLVIAPVASAANSSGIDVSAASQVSLEDSVISGFSLNGLRAYNLAEVSVANTTFRQSNFGVLVSGSAKVALSGSRFVGNLNALMLKTDDGPNPTANVTDTVFSKNGGSVMCSLTSGTAKVNLTRVMIEGSSQVGISSSSGLTGFATLVMNSVMLVNNVLGWNLSGPGTTLFSAGNNLFRDNGTGTGSPTGLTLQ